MNLFEALVLWPRGWEYPANNPYAYTRMHGYVFQFFDENNNMFYDQHQ